METLIKKANQISDDLSNYFFDERKKEVAHKPNEKILGMNGKYLIGAILIIFTCSGFSGCEERQGCTDVTACNFDAEAEDDDGSCNYGCNPIPDEDEMGTECTTGEIKFNDVLAQTNINCFDFTIGSPYEDQIFTILNITQNRFLSCENGHFELKGYTENIISFKNLTTNVISFDYQISQNFSGYFKEYQGYVSKLPPNQVYEINTGNNTFYNLNNSLIQVIMNNVIYE